MFLICFSLKFIHKQMLQIFPCTCVCVWRTEWTTARLLVSVTMSNTIKGMPQEESAHQATDKHRYTHTQTLARKQRQNVVDMRLPASPPSTPPSPPSDSARFLVPQATNPFRLLFLTCATTTTTKTTAANQKLNTHTHSQINTHRHTHTHKRRHSEIHTNRPLFLASGFILFLVFASFLTNSLFSSLPAVLSLVLSLSLSDILSLSCCAKLLLGVFWIVIAAVTAHSDSRPSFLMR